MKKILVTPRGYAKYGQEARKRLEALGYTMDINDSFQLAEIKTPKAWAESKLNELNLRRKYGLNVIFIKCQDGTVIVTPGPETILHAEDGLVICGSKHDIARVVQDI